jgi:translation initiation factor IF-1
MFKSRKAKRNDSWEGVVTDKSRGMLDGSNMYRFVEVRLTDGESVKIRISGRLWKSIAVGDRIVKRPGTDPVKG